VASLRQAGNAVGIKLERQMEAFCLCLRIREKMADKKTVYGKNTSAIAKNSDCRGVFVCGTKTI
jgi:hypothetical protein